MDKTLEFIKENKLINPGEIIGVAVSGGRDSMALLHFLNASRDELDCEIIAINIDHRIRPTSALDSEFVMDYCKEHHIRAYKFNVDSLRVANENKMSVEQAAREARYGVFESLIEKGLVDKIALGHHLNDQAETILLNIFRGSGVNGAKGMEAIRDGKYIRPFLQTPRADIDSYVLEHDLSFVEDESNAENSYTRNFMRNIIMPLLRKKFNNLEKNLISFASLCKQDDEYISGQVQMGAIIEQKNLCQIPIKYFDFPEPIVNRMLLKVFSKFYRQLGDTERRHILMVAEFARNGENGTKISLPNGLRAYKEYEYLTVTIDNNLKIKTKNKFAKGTLHLDGYGDINVKACKKVSKIQNNQFIIDADKLCDNAIWRYRQEGDVFTPFGFDGTKKLKEYLIDKKVPQRLRNDLPVLAVDNKILIIAGIEICDELKITNNTENMYKITFNREFI